MHYSKRMGFSVSIEVWHFYCTTHPTQIEYCLVEKHLFYMIKPISRNITLKPFVIESMKIIWNSGNSNSRYENFIVHIFFSFCWSYVLLVVLYSWYTILTTVPLGKILLCRELRINLQRGWWRTVRFNLLNVIIPGTLWFMFNTFHTEGGGIKCLGSALNLDEKGTFKNILTEKNSIYKFKRHRLFSCA